MHETYRVISRESKQSQIGLGLRQNFASRQPFVRARNTLKQKLTTPEKTLKIQCELRNQHNYELVQKDGGIGICSESFEKSGVVFRRHHDFFENDEIEITIDRSSSSNAFAVAFFLQPYTQTSFKSGECESVYE